MVPVFLPPHIRAMLVESLRYLADRSFQERSWVRGEGTQESTFAELICQIFDDTALTDLLASDRAELELGADAERELRKLSVLIDTIPCYMDPAARLRLPVWDEVVRTAARAADLVEAWAN